MSTSGSPARDCDAGRDTRTRDAAQGMNAKTATIKVLAGNDASLAVARRLGAKEVGTEPPDAGGVFVVFGLALTVEGDRA
jgi:hypothetical protein